MTKRKDQNSWMLYFTRSNKNSRNTKKTISEI